MEFQPQRTIDSQGSAGRAINADTGLRIRSRSELPSTLKTKCRIQCVASRLGEIMKHVILVLIFAMSVMPGVSQTPAQTPQFEVASVKPNNSGSQAISFLPSAGRFNAQNVTLSMLINRAYKVEDFQVVGAPAWVSSEHYDIDARADAAATPQDIKRAPASGTS
jgi:hypothetical protein